VQGDRNTPAEPPAATPVERLLEKDRDVQEGRGRPFSRRAMQTQRSLEDYLKAGNRPRWMERLVDIERGVAAEQQRLARAHRELREEFGPDREGFARRWRAEAHAWRFDERLHELVAQHNEYFPIERQLPMDPRTRDYVLIQGRSYRKPELTPEWVLEQFPAE
jgi:hypothetical protein